MDTPIFDQDHLKIIERTFNFPEFDPAYKKSVHSINAFLRYSQFQCSVTRLATSISGHIELRIFWSPFNLCEFESTCKKFIDLFWRYGWLENPEIWLAENIFTHISGNKVFPSIGFMQEQSKCNKCSL